MHLYAVHGLLTYEELFYEVISERDLTAPIFFLAIF